MKALLTILAVLAFALPAAAQWVEQDDAGDLPATAQIPAGEGALVTITGTAPANDVDMYCIQVAEPATFSASLCDGGANWDTQVFIFTAAGVGVIWDDDACTTYSLASLVGAFDTCQYQVGPGLYYIAISKYNRDPRDAAGAAVFGSSGCNTLNGNPVASWTGTTTTGGDYTITMTSVNYCGTVATENQTWGAIKSMYR